MSKDATAAVNESDDDDDEERFLDVDRVQEEKKKSETADRKALEAKFQKGQEKQAAYDATKREPKFANA